MTTTTSSGRSCGPARPRRRRRCHGRAATRRSPANLRVKEVRVSDHERFVICHKPEGAERDAAVRARLLAQLETLIADTDMLTPVKRAELRGVISKSPA